MLPVLNPSPNFQYVRMLVNLTKVSMFSLYLNINDLKLFIFVDICARLSNCRGLQLRNLG